MASIRNIRLYIDCDLIISSNIELDDMKSHYLCNVMRCTQGENIKCFNSQDGEFLCEIQNINRKSTTIKVLQQIKTPSLESDIWLIFAPLKKDKTDFVIEKAVELGVSKIIPVITQHTNSEKIKVERYKQQAIEAAEQCERLSIPQISTAKSLTDLLTEWNKERVLFFMNEQRNGQDAITTFTKYANKPAAILIGPEGGFSTDEIAKISAQDFVKNISLGPRILRAETAATASLAVWQSCVGDWKKSKENL